MDVVSLLVGLAPIVFELKKVYDFWKAVEGSSREVETVLEEIEALIEILNRIENREFASESKASEIARLERFLSICRENAHELVVNLTELDKGFRAGGRAKGWSSLKAALRNSSLGKFRESNERMKALCRSSYKSNICTLSHAGLMEIQGLC